MNTHRSAERIAEGTAAGTVASADSRRARWARAGWVGAGALALLIGVVGVFLPLLPTTPFVLVAAFCFARGNPRWEAWLLAHPRFGPSLRDWRERRAIALRAKWLAWTMMALGSAWSWWLLPPRWGWMPAALCVCLALWMWRLPTR
jgi:uncharacterized membrane protein YbaN (DUF454 family)